MTCRLRDGDSLTVHISEETSSEKILPVQLPLEILYEDPDLMIINKAAGMPIHPSMNNRDNSVANALAWYFRQQDVPFVFRCINRLDRDTSGLTIIAKHFVSAGMLSAIFHMNSDLMGAACLQFQGDKAVPVFFFQNMVMGDGPFSRLKVHPALCSFSCMTLLTSAAYSSANSMAWIQALL